MVEELDLSRFVDAQRPVYDQVMTELRAGRKKGHWMWFVFPQLQGLGHSGMAQRFAITGADEARAYLRHELLGPRLESCVRVILSHRDKTAYQIFGSPDELKLCSCLTLFAGVSDDPGLFTGALNEFFDDRPDQTTLALLHRPLTR